MFDFAIIIQQLNLPLYLWLIYIFINLPQFLSKSIHKILSRSPPMKDYLISNPKLIVRSLRHNSLH